MTGYHLETRFNGAESREDATLTMTLHNLSDVPLSGARLGFASISRMYDETIVRGADRTFDLASYHEVSMPEGLVVPPGGTWSFSIAGLEQRIPTHRTEGPKSAVLHFDGVAHEVLVGDMMLDGGEDTGNLKEVPEGTLDLPLLLQPWPAEHSISDFGPAAYLSPESQASREDRAAVTAVSALHGRLFPEATRPFRLDSTSTQIRFSRSDLGAEAFSVTFNGSLVELSYGDDSGRFYGLVALAQMAHGAFSRPDLFQFPTSGTLSDTPRFGYRGGQLDVSRHFWTVGKVKRFLDTMAWSRMNVFQWHLTDDEGWRIQIDAYPELTSVGSSRGPGCELVGQLGFCSEVYAGHYGKDEIRDVVGYAADLGIQIIPEIDIPGHCAAVLAALPFLVDPDEPANSYRSVQGFPNNALNPGLPETFEFIEKVMAEVATLFPSTWIHVGADEVADGAWLRSPRSQVLMQREGLSTTSQFQAYFLRQVQKILRGLGKELAGWNEVSNGGGVDQEGTLLIAWERPDVVHGLAEAGYQVVASPGQAYYMDMVQADGWKEPGASWAGTVRPEQTYAYDPEGGLNDAQRGGLAGVQACIWGEHILNVGIFNHMVFPRFYAVAEAGWTPQAKRDWLRFATLSRHMPKL